MKRLPLLIPCLALATLLATQLAFAQEGMKMLKPAAFTNPQRPPAVFKHDEHNQKAKLDDCVRCHHGVENGKRSTSVSSEGTPCADCHKVKPTDGTTSLTKAYHSQCIGCHQKLQKGPVACGQCHVRAR